MMVSRVVWAGSPMSLQYRPSLIYAPPRSSTGSRGPSPVRGVGGACCAKLKVLLCINTAATPMRNIFPGHGSLLVRRTTQELSELDFLFAGYCPPTLESLYSVKVQYRCAIVQSMLHLAKVSAVLVAALRSSFILSTSFQMPSVLPGR